MLSAQQDRLSEVCVWTNFKFGSYAGWRVGAESQSTVCTSAVFFMHSSLLDCLLSLSRAKEWHARIACIDSSPKPSVLVRWSLNFAGFLSDQLPENTLHIMRLSGWIRQNWCQSGHSTLNLTSPSASFNQSSASIVIAKNRRVKHARRNHCNLQLCVAHPAWPDYLLWNSRNFRSRLCSCTGRSHTEMDKKPVFKNCPLSQPTSSLQVEVACGKVALTLWVCNVRLTHILVNTRYLARASVLFSPSLYDSRYFLGAAMHNCRQVLSSKWSHQKNMLSTWVSYKLSHICCNPQLRCFPCQQHGRR